MSKQMIGKLFFGSLAAFVGSLMLTGAAVMVAVNRDVFIMNGPDVVGVRSGSGAWARSPRREAAPTRRGSSCCWSWGCSASGSSRR